MGKIRNFIRKLRILLNVDFDEFKRNQEEMKEQIKLLEGNVDRNLNTIDSIKSNLETINNNLDRTMEKINQHDYSNPELIQTFASNRTDKKKVLICGFYGAFNLGDELMLETLLNNIPNKDNLDITIMLADNKNTDITKYGKYHFIHYPKTIFDLNYLADFYDVLIFGGGALLDDDKYDVVEPHMTLGRILINLSMRFIAFEKTTILYGLSSNKKIVNPEFIEKLDYIVKFATYFSLRDTNSLNSLKTAGIDVSKIKIDDDIVFANDYPVSKRKSKNEVLNVGIIYICFDELKDDLVSYTKKVISYLKSKNQKYKLNFIPFYNYQDRDKVFYEDFIKELDEEDIEICDFKLRFNEITELLNEQDLIISMRYHGSLMANMLNRKTITILSEHRHYENKMFYLHDNYGFPKNIFRKIDTETLEKVLDSNIKKNDNEKISIKAKEGLKEVLKKI